MNDSIKYNRILVATDFSSSAEAALRQAIWIARLNGSKIVLAHSLPDLKAVVHRASYEARMDLLEGEGKVFDWEVRQQSDAKLRQLIASMNATDLDMRYETFLGDPFVELIQAVQSEGYDLVLAGVRGLSTWEQLLLGSTASRLVQKCPASVWVVKSQHVGPPKVVLAATDFSEISWKAVKHGYGIAQLAKASFHLLHVIDERDTPIPIAAHGNRKDINEAVEKRLNHALEAMQIDRTKIELHLSVGAPWKEVIRLSQHLKVDLITMGTVGRSGIQGLLLGNTADKVLRTCDCSILTVKPDGFVSPIHPAKL
jgi:nucleotide-binding universal stress UspA family protein